MLTDKKNEWDLNPEYYSKDIMHQRIISTISLRGWQHAANILRNLEIPMNHKVID